jgi:hypothetical protein
MHARLFPLWGALLLAAVGGLGCSDKGQPPPEPPDGSFTDGGLQPQEDGGQALTSSDFACDVARQRGCDAGQSCLFHQLGDGGTGSTCFAGACDTVSQNCPGGQRCTYARGDGGTFRTCVAEGTVAEGGPCQLGASEPLGIDTCKKGLFCTDVTLNDGGTAFQCARLCHGTATCTAPRECNEVLRFNGTAELPLICGAPSQRCDLLAQDCETPLSCYPANGSALCATTGNLSEGAPCEFSNQCARGSACVRTGTALTCRTLCRYPSGQPGCAAGRRCEALQGSTGIGACIP